jgi:hypothetical protein
MEKINLTINEVLVLEQDVADMLNKELPFKLRFRIMELAKEIVAKLTTFKELNNSLIKEYGTEKNNQIVIERLNDDGNFTEEFKQYTEKLKDLVSETVELNYSPINADSVPDSVTSTSSEVLFRLVN